MALSAQVIGQVMLLWELVDAVRLVQTFPPVAQAVSALVLSSRSVSSRLSASYLTAFGAAELGPGFRPVLAPAPPLSPRALETSLTVTGPVSVKRGMARGLTVERAKRNAMAATAGSASRHALSGGRELIAASVEADPQARRWRRVTSGGACEFCQMLASRDGVYRSSSTARFNAHDGCGCTAEPVYRPGDPGYEEWLAAVERQERALAR